MISRLPAFLLLYLSIALLGCSNLPPLPPEGPDCTVQRCLALTFDGGPDGNTAQILDILALHNATATFFLIGKKVASAPALVARIALEGHELGNHSWSHIPLPRLTEAQILADISATNTAIEAATNGIRPLVFRPPYGSSSPRVDQILPYDPVLWDLDSRDWDSKNRSAILREVGRARPGMILLFHSFVGATVRALPQVLQNFTDRGYTLVSVSQILAARSLR